MASGSADAALSVHWHDDDTAVLRQGKCVHFEAPFLFLLFGAERAILFDTGAVADAEVSRVRSTVDRLVDEWLEREGRVADPYDLVVAHTHPHGDHVAGDGQFAGRPNTVVVGHAVREVAAFFGLGGTCDSDPAAPTGLFDLGGRVLEVIAAPGHHAAAIAVIDSGTGWLLTGDTVYPGRLDVDDDLAFAATLTALVALARQRRVAAVVGCHIEMTDTAGVDYPVGTIEQPDEPALPMTLDRLEAVRDAAQTVVGHPGRQVHDDFVLVNLTP